LFFACTAVAIICGCYARALLRRSGGWWLRIIGVALAVLVGQVLLLNLSPSLTAAVYVCGVGAAAALGAHAWNKLPPTPDLLDRSWWMVRMAMLWICATGLFGRWVYPVANAQFGGGEAPIIFRGATQGASTDPGVGYWDRIRCPGMATSDSAACTTVRLIGQTSEHLYVSVRRSNSACVEKPGRWSLWPSYDGVCFARVGNKDVPNILFETTD
jgi:hypothetical protein